MSRPLPAAVRRIVQSLAEDYGAERVILFGSYAEGRAGDDSDVDLLVIKDTEAPHYDRIVQARRLVRDPNRDFPLDIIVLTPTEVEAALAAGDPFIAGVTRTGVVLHAS